MQTNKLTRREMLRLTAGLTTGAVAGTWLAGCAPAAPAGDTSGSAPEAAATELRIQMPALPAMQRFMEWALPAHKDEYPDVEIVLEDTIYGEIARKTETGFVAGTLQDICFGHMRWLFMGCYKGIYMPLEDYIASDPPADFEDFFPRWMEVNKFEGVQYQLPQYSKPGPVSSCIYNKQILEEAGVEEPTDDWTWLDLFEKAVACADEEQGIFGVNYRFGDNDIHSMTNVCRYFEEDNDGDNSGSLMVDDGTRFRMDTDTIQEAADFTLRLAHEHRAFPLAGDDVEGGLFAAGKMAFQVEQVANTYISALQQVGDRFEIGHIVSPRGPKGARGTVNVGNHWMINSKSEVKDTAWNLLLTMTSTEGCVRSALEGIEPGRRSAWVDPRVVEKVPMLSKSVHLMDDYLEDFPMPSNLRYVEANSIFRNEFALILEGEVTFDEYMPTIVDEVQAIVDEERPPAA